MTRQRGMGFIDFSGMGPPHDPDAWRDTVDKGGKLTVHRGEACHTSHPDLMLGGGTLIGGNCRDHERHEGVNLYIALDYSMSHPQYRIGAEPAACVYYPIENMKTPNRPDNFIALIEFIVKELGKGSRVHVGCIGGHGRTGLVIGAVVARLGVDPDGDAIGWVRSNYCKRAIETKEQENFLVVHFGAKLPPATQHTIKVDKR